MSAIPVALQLYSVRGEVAKDLPATLAKVAEIGYAGAEPWGYRGEALEWQGHSADAISTMFHDFGLDCCGIHLTTDALAQNLPRTIEFNYELGNNFLIIAGDKPRMEQRETILELADILNRTAEALAEHDMFCGYHAHPFDFAEVDGEIAWDILFSHTAPAVIMQMDIGNCLRGGGDPVAHLRKFPGTTRSLHLKDYGGPEDAVIGEGEADWDAVWAAVDELQPVEWYVVEEGGADGLGFDVSARSLAALRRMGRA